MGKRINPMVDVPFGKTKEQNNIYYKRWRELNKEDYNKKRKEWADKNREKRTRQARSSHLRVKFGISLDEYEEIFKKQNGLCAICNKKQKISKDILGRKNYNLYIDHCHKSGKIRGLLCNKCNQGIGYLCEDIEIIKKAIIYLLDDKSLNAEELDKIIK